MKINHNHKIQVKICGVTNHTDLTLLDQLGVDYGGLWFNVPNGKYNLSKDKFVQLAKASLQHLQCIGVTTENNPDVLYDYVLASGIKALQLHGFLLPVEILAIKQRLGESVKLFKVIHIQRGKCLEKRLLQEYKNCGIEAFILDNFISREQSGSTGQCIPNEVLKELLAFFGNDNIFLAGGLDKQRISTLRTNYSLKGIDIDTGARVNCVIDSDRVKGLVMSANSTSSITPDCR